MKKLDNVFKNEKNKKSSILDKEIKVDKELTTPRKVYNEDYEIIRLFAFNNRITMLETTEHLYELVKDDSLKINLNNINEDDYTNNSDNEKSLRISIKLNKHLRKLSDKTGIASKYIFSYLVHECLGKEGAYD